MNLATHFYRSKTVGGLAPGLLGGLSIGRYEKKSESLDLFAAKFKSGAM